MKVKFERSITGPLKDTGPCFHNNEGEFLSVSVGDELAVVTKDMVKVGTYSKDSSSNYSFSIGNKEFYIRDVLLIASV